MILMILMLVLLLLVVLLLLHVAGGTAVQVRDNPDEMGRGSVFVGEKEPFSFLIPPPLRVLVRGSTTFVGGPKFAANSTLA